MMKSDFIRRFATEEEFSEKIIFGEAFRNILLKPAIQFELSSLCQTIDLAIRTMLLNNHLGLDQAGIIETLQRGINLAVASIPVAGQGAVKCLFDIVAAHRSRAKQTENNIAERVA